MRACVHMCSPLLVSLNNEQLIIHIKLRSLHSFVFLSFRCHHVNIGQIGLNRLRIATCSLLRSSFFSSLQHCICIWAKKNLYVSNICEVCKYNMLIHHNVKKKTCTLYIIFMRLISMSAKLIKMWIHLDLS